MPRALCFQFGLLACRSRKLQMAPVSRAVHIGMVESLGIMQQGKTFEDFPHLAQAANKMLDDMSWWAKTLKPAREGMTTGVARREQRGKAVAVTE
jgi:hypothetical protein